MRCGEVTTIRKASPRDNFQNNSSKIVLAACNHRLVVVSIRKVNYAVHRRFQLLRPGQVPEFKATRLQLLWQRSFAYSPGTIFKEAVMVQRLISFFPGFGLHYWRSFERVCGSGRLRSRMPEDRSGSVSQCGGHAQPVSGAALWRIPSNGECRGCEVRHRCLEKRDRSWQSPAPVPGFRERSGRLLWNR